MAHVAENEEDYFYCISCDNSTFTSRKAMENHNDRVHRNFKKKCKKCLNALRHAGDLANHDAQGHSRNISNVVVRALFPVLLNEASGSTSTRRF